MPSSSPRLSLQSLQSPIAGPYTLELWPGECVAIMGASGAGKSVLLRLIADLDPGSGTVLLNNQSSLSGFLTEYDWFQCPPGETCTVQFTPLGTVTGTPTLTMTASPAWW